MAVSQFDPLWKLMSQYSFEADPDYIHEDLICVICHKLMVDACQSVCGCQYCHECISDYIGTQMKYCPGNKEEYNEECLVLERDVVRNKRMNNKISKLRVKCPNQSCQLMTELSDMDAHLRVCTKQRMECPYIKVGCNNVERSKVSVDDHLQKDTFRHSRLLVEFINNLTNEVNQLKCNLEESRLEVSSLKEESKMKDVQIRGILGQIDGQKKEVEYLNEESKKKDNRINQLEADVDKEKDNMRMMYNDVIKSVEDAVVVRDRSEDDRRLRFDNLVRFCLNRNFDYIWRIEDWDKNMRAMASIGSFTQSFYSHNYKLCLYVYVRGDSIALYCYIMRGDNDNKVQWPMKRAVTLSIMDQCTFKSHTSVTFQYEFYVGDKRAFDRPKHDRSNYFGSDSFVTYSSIKDSPFIIMDGAIVITCIVGDPL